MNDAASDYDRAARRAGQECLAAALDYLARGWSVLALCPPDHMGVGKAHGKSCSEPGKRPWPNGGRWKEYQDRLPTPEEVRGWWAEHPCLNVGIALGPVSGLVRIDVDGEGGEAALREMSGGDLPPTLEFLSGRPDGGRGLLYAVPRDAELRTTVRHTPGMELRLQARGAETVLPPSRHASGGHYTWVSGRGPGDLAPAPAPRWLLDALSPVKATAGRRAAEALADGELITEPGRNTFLASLAGSMRRRGMHEEAILAGLEAMNRDRCEPPLPDAEVEKIARSVSRYKPEDFVVVLPRQEVEGPGGAPSAAPGLDLKDLATVKPQPVNWLVPDLIPLGKLVLWAGDGGHGKSTLTLSLAADLSRGRPCLGHNYAAPGPSETLIACCEDDYADTVVPRLLSHGADLSRIHTIEGIKVENGKTAPFSLACYEAIETELTRRPDVRLVIIDPAGAFIGRTGIDDYKDSELRALLGPLSDLAARTGVTILLVKHLVKGATVKAVHRVGGSAGYVNAVRAAFVIAPDADDPDLKLFLPLKFNLGPRPKGFAYRLTGLSPEATAGVLRYADHLPPKDQDRLAKQLFHVEWVGDVETSADDALGVQPRSNATTGANKTERCQAFLSGLFDLHPVFFPSDMIEAKARELGFSRGTYDNARKALKDNWTLRACRVGDRWYVGPRDKNLELQDENRLLGSLGSWVLRFLEEEEPKNPRTEEPKEPKNQNTEWAQESLGPNGMASDTDQESTEDYCSEDP